MEETSGNFKQDVKTTGYKNLTGNENNNNIQNKFKQNIRVRKPAQEQLDIISLALLNSVSGKYNDYEMEAKFGTRGIRPISNQDYDNVVRKIKSMGFGSINESGSYSLKIQPEFLDVRTGEFKTSNDLDKFRVEINGMVNIQEYCRTNELKTINNSYVTFLRKLDVRPNKDINEIIDSANFDDFNFRVTYKNEETVNKSGKIGMDIVDNWNKSKKVFRYINRVTFTHSDLPFKIDLSIVKSSKKDNKYSMIKTYYINESNVFNNPETYEIEIEVINNSARMMYKTPQALSAGIQQVSKYILSGLQRTNYPVSYPEQKTVISDYFKLLFEEEYSKRHEEYRPKDRAYPRDFIGPSSKTLQLINVAPINPDFNAPNITLPYSYIVTDKADGERHLLFINGTGKIYLINTNMSVIFTGAKTQEDRCFNSILDGELILHDKNDKFINTFAAFDIYYIKGADVRSNPFVKTELKEEKYFEKGVRLNMLKEFIKLLKPNNITSNQSNRDEKNLSVQKLLETFNSKNKSPINIISKKFYPLFDTYNKEEPYAIGKYNIFEACNFILRRIKDNLYEYNTDGLIFTPTIQGVGSSKFLEAGPKHKITWEYSFKWKPSEKTETFPKSFNTIDFLVTTKKAADGNDVVVPIFENGTNMMESSQFNEYKTLILAVGFDERKHGYINPCQDVLDEKYSVIKDDGNEDGYKPKQFFPSDPYDPQAGLCNIMLVMDDNGAYQMMSEENQIIEDNMIVEFRYDTSKTGLWKWIPLRVRYDKTAEFRQGLNSFGNDYTTANSNWYSIHNPVTEKMIATGQDIPSVEIADDVYYNSVTSEKMTVGLRDFHNLFVKKILIQNVSKRGNILMDFACGKAGDLPKWIASNLSFVLGVDISRDNIENRLNGACSRFLTYKKTTKKMPDALFLVGNSSLNIRNGTNMFSDKSNAIVKSIFGDGPNDKNLGPAVVSQHGKASNGFDVTSCQFALHYMFENNRTFYNFMRNVAECTKLHGYFIATCYDGKTLFNMLKKKLQGESLEIFADDKKVWSVTKNYDGTLFEDNDSSLGYKISVYQDSINQTIDEYLVNFDFIISAMEKYGFALVTRDEAKIMGLPEGSGMFVELYNKMLSEVNRDPKKENDYKTALNMKKFEKEISFLNRYFIFKKIRTINAEKLTRSILEQLPQDIDFEHAETMLARESVKKAEEEIKPRARKLKQTLKLQDATEALDEEVNVNVNVNVNKDVLENKPRKKSTKKEKVVELEQVNNEGRIKVKAKKTTKTAKKSTIDFNIVEE